MLCFCFVCISFYLPSAHLFLQTSNLKCHSVSQKVFQIILEKNAKYLLINYNIININNIFDKVHAVHYSWEIIADLPVGRWIESKDECNQQAQMLFSHNSGCQKCPNICQTVTAVSWTSIASKTWPLWIIPPAEGILGFWVSYWQYPWRTD